MFRFSILGINLQNFLKNLSNRTFTRKHILQQTLYSAFEKTLSLSFGPSRMHLRALANVVATNLGIIFSAMSTSVTFFLYHAEWTAGHVGNVVPSHGYQTVPGPVAAHGEQASQSQP